MNPLPKIQIRFVKFDKALVAQVLWYDPNYITTDEQEFEARNGVAISLGGDGHAEMGSKLLVIPCDEEGWPYEVFTRSFDDNEKRDEAHNEYIEALREWSESATMPRKQKSQPIQEPIPGLETF